MRVKQLLLILILVFLIAGLIFTARGLNLNYFHPSSTPIPNPETPALPAGRLSPTPLVTQTLGENTEVLHLVTKVIDGDTIEIESGEKIRFIGINTPETVDPRRKVECFGREASLKTKQLLEGKRVHLEKDINETDKFGRLLRYIHLGDLFVNEYLAREGFAYSSSYPPDIKYQTILDLAAEEAKENKRGLWAICQTK